MIPQKTTSETKSDYFILTQENGSFYTYNIKIDLSSFKDSNSIQKTVEDIGRELVEKFFQTKVMAPSQHDKKDLSKKETIQIKEKDVLIKFCFDLQSNLRGKNLA